MGYLIQQESEKRLDNVRKLLEAKKLDLALVYYDEFNIGNGWYLTGDIARMNDRGYITITGRLSRFR